MTSQYFNRHLSLGHYTVCVQASRIDDVELAEQGVVGDSDLDAGIIRVRSDLTRQRQREVVLHELLHHVVHMTHLEARWDEDEQEEVIRALSPWLAQLVTINNYEW